MAKEKLSPEEKIKELRSPLTAIKSLIERAAKIKDERTMHFHTVHAEVFAELVELYPAIEVALKK